MKPAELMTHVFPDTEEGAMAYLRAETEGEINMDICLVSPDPQVNGVWKVDVPRDSVVEYCIVYLAGYMMPNGVIRDTNDFESFYAEEE